MNKAALAVASVLGLAFLAICFAVVSYSNAEESLWTLKYQFDPPRHIVNEKIVVTKGATDEDLPKLEIVRETFWYQTFVLTNPLKESLFVPFDCIVLLDTVESVRSPKTGKEISVAGLMPAFDGEPANFVVDPDTGEQIVIPGKAYRPVLEPGIMKKIIEKIRLERIRAAQVNPDAAAENTRPAVVAWFDHLGILNDYSAEETRYGMVIFKNFLVDFDRAIFMYGGLTNEYVFDTPEAEKEGKARRKLLRAEYARPGDGFETDDENPSQTDPYYLQSQQWVLENLQ